LAVRNAIRSLAWCHLNVRADPRGCWSEESIVIRSLAPETLLRAPHVEA
jgi:hypothetical protein